ncbi:M3 family oligoendopeptidase [Neobacillus mesonae]|uniref:M3 family oligoendopeptidase n=1 Tax=Neobacillus mesonae TaxID=1193713 RepID=UPI002E210795|nr:M3 family oligoendopeptidase [Neobacillus mesonae]
MIVSNYSQVWDLERIFLGGSDSASFKEHLKQLESKINKLEQRVSSFKTPHEINDSIQMADLIDYIANIRIHLSQANSFITCLLSQNSNDQQAVSLRVKATSLVGRYEDALKKVQRILLKTNITLWNEIVGTKELSTYKFLLNEWREKAAMLLSEEEESLVSSLMVNGYHAWGQFYQSLISSISVNIPMDGEVKKLSVGQAINLRSHPVEEVRKAAHYALEGIWKEKEELFAKILNHIAGYRLQASNKRRITNMIEEPLLENRLKEKTLNAMWEAVNKYKLPFMNYLKQKAEMLGTEKMPSYNFWAPITETNQTIKYEDAVDFILNRFCHFGNELESFTRQAFENGWIESENRPNKSQVAFCAGFPLSGESRIFMTYSDTITNVLTLAHELGHAFHNDAMKQVNGLNRHYPLSIAETASTFAEMIILDAAKDEAETVEDKLFLLDEKLKRSVMNFMNIQSRFMFEQTFYEERKKGFVSSSRLNELMQEAIEKCYGDSFDSVSSRSWIWTPHFYITHSPFYNFPYTFGYLISISMYAISKKKGKEFEKNYIELLHDSGSMSTEDLVMKHLGEDITSAEFWEKGMELCVKDAVEFISITSQVG